MTHVDIDTAIQNATGFTKSELLQDTRVKDIREARQIAMSFYILNGSSIRFASISFGRKHPTALQSLNKLRILYGQKCENKLKERIDKICELTGIEFPNQPPVNGYRG